MSFHETMDTLDDVRHSSPMSSKFFVEAVAYQSSRDDEFERRAFSVQAMHPIRDKRASTRCRSLHQKRHGEIPAHQKRGADQSSTRLREREALTI
ncbi:MAG TPA: hypothetical protein VHY35_00420 [Stellaceae bacterium]|nr:hypothetical protein [Stellaceae bacterium]